MNRILLFSLLITLSFTSCYSQHASSGEVVEHTGNRAFEEDILHYINEYRESKGLSPLVMNEVISEQAEIHSRNMAQKKVAFSHDGFEKRIKNITQKLGPLKASAENVAYGELSAKQVVELWLKSAGHRKNIEGKYVITGIGTAKAKDGTTYFTQLFSVTN